MPKSNQRLTPSISISDLKTAIVEANRCLYCKSPRCKEGCPIGNDIPEFISALARGNLGEARRVIARTSNLPAICGRVCAHEHQCEGHCILGKKGAPIRIGMLETTIADFGFEMALPLDHLPQKNRGSVAVVGSGPAGLTVAGDLAKEGFEVTVFEALEEPGGILLYGIPSFRLSKKIVRREIQNIELLGVRFQTECSVGADVTVDELFAKGFDAVFIGSGTSIPKDIELPGRALQGVYQASHLLRMSYLHRSGQLERHAVPVQPEDHVVVIGGGNVAIDAARTAKRLGAASVTLAYRGVREKMKALPSEYEAAVADGVVCRFEHAPLAFLGEEETLTAFLAQTPQGEATLQTNRLFLALGSRPSGRIISTTQGIAADDSGYIVIKERPYGMTTRKGVFAGGDVVHRPASVVLAVKEAKRVAQGIAQYIDAVKLLALP